MHPSRHAFLMDDRCRAIRVSYDPDRSRNSGSYDTEFKTLDETIEVGDIVVIPTGTRYKATCGKVEEVDIDVDLESGYEIQWIIDKVDMETHERKVEIEAENNSKIMKARKHAQRERLRKEMEGFQMSEMKSLDAPVPTDDAETSTETKKAE